MLACMHACMPRRAKQASLESRQEGREREREEAKERERREEGSLSHFFNFALLFGLSGVMPICHVVMHAASCMPACLPRLANCQHDARAVREHAHACTYASRSFRVPQDRGKGEEGERRKARKRE